jgi:hypothetical protein
VPQYSVPRCPDVPRRRVKWRLVAQSLLDTMVLHLNPWSTGGGKIPTFFMPRGMFSKWTNLCFHDAVVREPSYCGMPVIEHGSYVGFKTFSRLKVAHAAMGDRLV